jgi:PAS domain S-box-containing protein
MTQTHNNSGKMLDLRQRAETKISGQAVNPGDLSTDEIKRLMHELSVHQIELELQNEELRASQAELEASRRKYIDMYEYSPAGLLILDQNEYIQDPNLTFTTMLGVTRHKLAKRTLSSFVTPESQDTFHFFYQNLRTTQQPQQCELMLEAAAQAPLPVRLDGIVLVQNDGPATYRIAVTDLTLQKQVEAQKMELEAERQRMKVLSDFVRDLSEDIRSPISAMITNLYLAGKTSQDEGLLEKLEVVTKHLFHLNTVLDQLQQMAVLDNLMILERQPDDINQLVLEVVQTFKAQAIAKKIKLAFQPQDNLPQIPLDINSMDRALKNLIENAIRFTDKGGKVLVTTALEDNNVVIEVTDSGIGIDAETLPHIFKRFFKANIPEQKQSGAGLGLSMTRRIIALHHGTVEARSTPGLKTTFTIKLPFH